MVRLFGTALIAILVGLLTAVWVTLADNRDQCKATITYTHYDVAGASLERLQEQLRSKGPRDSEGKVRFAYTHWNVKWRWHNAKDGRIDVNSVRLFCSATVQLPRLVEREKMPKELLVMWDAFLERTRRHELNHVGHMESVAPKISQLMKEHAGKDARITSAAASSIVRSVVSEIHALDRKYDGRTNHGKTEGTWSVAGASVRS